MTDLYVREPYRSFGIGKMIFKEVTRYTRDLNYKLLNWYVLDWNEQAKKFYQKLGAVDLTEMEGSKFYRFKLD